jgi:DME family drug/metabolite transporter
MNPSILLCLSFLQIDQFVPAGFKGELFAICSAVCWAIGASVYRKGLEKTNALTGNLIRTGFTSAGFFLLLALNGSLSEALHMLTPSLLFWLFFSAFFGFFLGDFLFLTALKTIGVSRTVPVTCTYPLFVALWVSFIYGISVSIFLIVGMILIIAAIKLMSEEKKPPQDERKLRISSRSVGIALLAAVCWSVSITVLDHLLLALSAEAVAGFRLMIAFLLSSAWGSKKSLVFSKHALLWIGIVGMVVLVSGNYFFLEAIRLVGSAKVAPISSSYPIISIVFAAFFLKEKPTSKIIVGASLSFLGVMLVVLS